MYAIGRALPSHMWGPGLNHQHCRRKKGEWKKGMIDERQKWKVSQLTKITQFSCNHWVSFEG